MQIYPVRNGNAAQLAGLLSTIYGGSGGGGSKSSGVAPGMKKAKSGGGSGAAAGGSGKGASGGGTFSLDDDIRVVADEFNNTLLVYATPYEYQKISRILQKLDRIQTQVLIEASIVEVQLVGDLQYGIEWMFNNNLGGGDTGTGMLDLGGGLQPTTGFSYQITNSAVETMAVINALATKSLINVISTPSVMVLDNHTAMINVGNQQPIQDRTTVSDGGVITNSITYKDTGVQLTSRTPVTLIEAARAFGATPRQLLWKVELPSALPQIMAGLNQTIMLSLSMVVIAALVGADGLGVPVVRALNTVNAGLGFESGLVIVAVAIALDRMLRVETPT